MNRIAGSGGGLCTRPCTAAVDAVVSWLNRCHRRVRPAARPTRTLTPYVPSCACEFESRAVAVQVRGLRSRATIMAAKMSRVEGGSRMGPQVNTRQARQVGLSQREDRAGCARLAAAAAGGPPGWPVVLQGAARSATQSRHPRAVPGSPTVDRDRPPGPRIVRDLMVTGLRFG